MAIYINEPDKIFTLETNKSTYQMKIDYRGLLLHSYYGRKIEKASLTDLGYNLGKWCLSFSPYDHVDTEDGWNPHSVDILPQEIFSEISQRFLLFFFVSVRLSHCRRRYTVLILKNS